MAFLSLTAFRSSGPLRRYFAAAAFACGISAAHGAPAAPTLEHQIKAAALCNIISFTDWPATAFQTPDAPLVIGVLGQGPIAALLGDFIAAEVWHGRRVELRPLASVAEAHSCHVLYVDRNEHPRWRTISSQFAGRPILTVGDEENFARDGGIVQLAINRNKLQIIVNRRVVQASGLIISSKVLRLAEMVDSPKS